VTLSYFELFGLSPAFNIDLAKLEINYRKIQSESHPDRFVTGTATEKLQSMQTSTLANAAYQVLKNPADRAKYLLELQGINATAESNTAMPDDFLIQQIEWREAIDDAAQTKNIKSLESLLSEMQLEAKTLQANLVDLMDVKKDYGTALGVARELIFIDKVCADINKAIESLDS
jgi:molecular chaperone HscB